jgi:hypothetical protein
MRHESKSGWNALPSLNQLPSRTDWHAVRNLVAAYLHKHFVHSPESHEPDALKVFRAHVRQAFLDCRTNGKLNESSRTKRSSSDDFGKLLAIVDPISFWPEVISTRHPDAFYWDAYDAAASKRFKMEFARIPEVLKNVAAAEFLQLPSPELKEAIKVHVQYAKEMMAAASRVYKKSFAEIALDEALRFEQDHWDVNPIELRKIGR